MVNDYYGAAEPPVWCGDGIISENGRRSPSVNENDINLQFCRVIDWENRRLKKD